MNIGILDYGVGNVGSLANMVKYIKHQPILSDKVRDLSDNKIIFIPGVGRFDRAIEQFSKNNNVEDIKNLIQNKEVHIIGICLGMHILFESSEEGSKNGLGLIKDKIHSFKNDGVLKVPHMGWNTIDDKHLPFSLDSHNRFYFCHSYYCRNSDQKIIKTETNYHINFNSMVWENNIIGIQFHPEKSGMNGAKFLDKLILEIK